MSERGELWAFVRRQPFIPERTLQDLYGEDVYRAMLRESERWLKKVEVKGIGPKTLESLRDRVSIGS